MAPEAICLMVIHDQRVRVKFSRHAEGQLPGCDPTVIHDGRIAKRSPSYCNRYPPDFVVDNLMAAQGRNRIGAAISANFNTDYKILPSEPGCLVSFLK